MVLPASAWVRAGVPYRSFSGSPLAPGSSDSAASIPTTWRVRVTPRGGPPLSSVACCAGAKNGTRMAVPRWTPYSRRLKEASTWSGSDGSGIVPATRLTTWDRVLVGARSRLNSSCWLMVRLQAQDGAPVAGLMTTRTERTSGSRAIFGNGAEL
jgi:hypothetical protein